MAPVHTGIPGPAREAQTLHGGRDIPGLKPTGQRCPQPSQELCLLPAFPVPPLGREVRGRSVTTYNHGIIRVGKAL